MQKSKALQITGTKKQFHPCSRENTARGSSDQAVFCLIWEFPVLDLVGTLRELEVEKLLELCQFVNAKKDLFLLLLLEFGSFAIYSALRDVDFCMRAFWCKFFCLPTGDADGANRLHYQFYGRWNCNGSSKTKTSRGTTNYKISRMVQNNTVEPVLL